MVWEHKYPGSSLVKLSLKSGMYCGYLAYEKYRVSLGNLAASPVKHIRNSYVWGSIAAFSVLGVFSINPTEQVPVSKSRETKIHGQAFSREFVYEELSKQAGPGGAKTVDALFFPLVHLPQESAEIQEGNMTWSDAIGNFFLRSGVTLLLDFAYDAGGLELSTAVHTWINMALHLSGFISRGYS